MVICFPLLHMHFGGCAAVWVKNWETMRYLRWRLAVEKMRLQHLFNLYAYLQAAKASTRLYWGKNS
jgi:hypothetical protein